MQRYIAGLVVATLLCIAAGTAVLLAATSYEYDTYYFDSREMALTYYPETGQPISEMTILTGTQITEHVPLQWQEQQDGSLVAEIDAPGATRLYIPESEFVTDLYVSFDRTKWYVEGRYFVKVQTITVTPTRRPTNTPTPTDTPTPTATPTATPTPSGTPEIYYGFLPLLKR